MNTPAVHNDPIRAFGKWVDNKLIKWSLAVLIALTLLVWALTGNRPSDELIVVLFIGHLIDKVNEAVAL